MSKRIQKLLISEYAELTETVLVESPFAEVNKHGIGLRQVELGVTPSKIIIALEHFEDGDKSISLPLTTNSNFIDPEIENLKLSSVIPLSAVDIFIYHKNSRKMLKIVFFTGKISYFEFGGHLFRNIFVSRWRDHIKSIRRRDPRSMKDIDLKNNQFVEYELERLGPNILREFLQNYDLQSNESDRVSSCGSGCSEIVLIDEIRRHLREQTITQCEKMKMLNEVNEYLVENLKITLNK